MKKLKITKTFRDKENNKTTIMAGEEIERPNKRADEIISAGFGEDITPEEPKKKKKSKKE